MKREGIITISITAVILAAGVNAGSGHRHWGYSGHEGPTHWAEMSKEFAICSVGTRQSPIDIQRHNSVKASIDGIKFSYNPVTPEVVNNGHTIQVNYALGSNIKVAGKQFDLLQFHFHSPSENTVSGEPYDMEMHLVHKSQEGELAVVGVFIKQGGENKVLDKTWEMMPTKAGQHKMLVGHSLNAADLLPTKHNFSHFKGSLTTPPCSEGVNWFVMNNPIEVSKSQLAKFIRVIGGNARPVQALNGRFVLAN